MAGLGTIVNALAIVFGGLCGLFARGFLKERYQAVELPYPPNVLREEILHIFADLTGELPEPGKHYYVDQFAKTHVGMSTGWISGDFWQATAIPLLMKRLEQANRS